LRRLSKVASRRPAVDRSAPTAISTRGGERRSDRAREAARSRRHRLLELGPPELLSRDHARRTSGGRYAATLGLWFETDGPIDRGLAELWRLQFGGAEPAGSPARVRAERAAWRAASRTHPGRVDPRRCSSRTTGCRRSDAPRRHRSDGMSGSVDDFSFSFRAVLVLAAQRAFAIREEFDVDVNSEGSYRGDARPGSPERDGAETVRDVKARTCGWVMPSSGVGSDGDGRSAA